jgi:hypothetical protein
MMDSVEKEDVLWWRRNFVAALQGEGDTAPEAETAVTAAVVDS